jgi:hypothetical protein
VPERGGVSRTALRGPLVGLAVLLAVVGVACAVGGVVGVGPLAATVPPDQVSDPREMLARSIQATIDAHAVHLEASLTGTIPGSLIGSEAEAVVLDGTRAEGDLRPHDAKTRAHVESPVLGVDLETVTVWDGAWYRTAADGPWTKASLGSLTAGSGLDLNPLTIVDRVRAWQAASGLEPTAVDVPCAGESGTCRHIVLEAGTEPAGILQALLTDEQAAALPEIATTITLDADVATLRPVRLVMEMRSEDGSVDLRLVLDASRWDDPGVVIEEPPSGS